MEIYLKVIFKDLFNDFHKDKLFIKRQPSFLPGDSSISQLLSIVHDINSSFDCHPTQDIRGIILDISNAFDKVCHEAVLFKLKTYCVKRELLNLLRNYLYERNQRVVFIGQMSSCEFIKYRGPQGSVPGPLLFLMYINDSPDNIQYTCKIFADGASLFTNAYDKYK